MLTFFIAGLLYLLCFEHVDNLGAYSIPSETGLLIPSVNNNHEGRKASAVSAARTLRCRFFYRGFADRCPNPNRVAAMATATKTVRSTAKSIAAVSNAASSERIRAARKSRASEIPR